MSAPFFSIVIPTYNRARRVAAAVRSVLAQTDGDFECFVVDDGSRDDTRRALEPLAERRVHFIFKDVNRGQHACRNEAIRAAKGQWIAFLDSDDVFLPQRLAALRQATARRPSIGFWFTNAYVHRYGRIVGTLFDPQRTLPQGRVPGYYAVGDRWLPYVTSTVLVRKSAFEKTGFFREDLRILEDTELYGRMLDGGLEVGGLGQPLAVRFLHDEQITQDHERDFAESLEALASAAAPPEVAARRRAELAVEVAGYLLKSLKPRQARELLCRELGDGARAHRLYWETFLPVAVLAAAKGLRRQLVCWRHRPATATAQEREVYRLLESWQAGG